MTRTALIVSWIKAFIKVCNREEISLHKTSNWAAGRTREDQSSVLWNKKQYFFKHMLRTVFSGLTQSTSRQKTASCTKQFLTMAFNPTNNVFFKTKRFLLYKRPNQNELHTMTCKVLKNTSEGSFAVRTISSFASLFSLQEVIWNVADSSSAANYFCLYLEIFDLLLLSVLSENDTDLISSSASCPIHWHFREFDDFWKVGSLKTEWLWIREKEASCGLISTPVPTHLSLSCTQYYFASTINWLQSPKAITSFILES